MGDLSPNFSRHEFACSCGCGLDTVDVELLEGLEAVRGYYGMPITVTSGCRCPEHNEAVGGSKNSFHLVCRAADIVVSGVEPGRVQAWMKQTWPDRYGIGSYADFTHFDTRSGPAVRWRG